MSRLIPYGNFPVTRQEWTRYMRELRERAKQEASGFALVKAAKSPRKKLRYPKKVAKTLVDAPRDDGSVELTIHGYGRRTIEPQAAYVLRAFAEQEQRRMWRDHSDDLVGVPAVQVFSNNTLNNVLIPYMVAENRKPVP